MTSIRVLLETDLPISTSGWRWTAHSHEIRIQHKEFSVAGAEISCHRCKRPTWAYSLFLPSGFLSRAPGSAVGWEQSPHGALFKSITDLQPKVAQTVLAIITHGFALDSSIGKGHPYWMNHCNHCGTRIGDYYLHAKENGPFGGQHRPGQSTVQTIDTFSQFIEFKAEISFSGQFGFYDLLEELHALPNR